MLDYNIETDEIWTYQKDAELQKWKFGGDKIEQYNTRFYETPEYEPIHAEIHCKHTKFSIVTFNCDEANPAYNVRTYKLGNKINIKFDVTKFADVYDPKLQGAAKYKKLLKVEKIANRLIA